jgi:hypothetical protein
MSAPTHVLQSASPTSWVHVFRDSFTHGDHGFADSPVAKPAASLRDSVEKLTGTPSVYSNLIFRSLSLILCNSKQVTEVKVMGISTQIDVRVIAKDGKYLGNDIGGALVTIHDVQTGELLAHGGTNGGSGEADLMTIALPRSAVLPVDQASVFTAKLDLDEPTLIRVTAYGPQAAQQSANTVSQTQWVYPGKDIVGGAKGGGLLLEIPGLVVQVLNPPTHYLPQTAPQHIEIRANVTMMCGCPIGVGHPPWHPVQFEVKAVIKQGTTIVTEVPLEYQEDAPFGVPSQFVGKWVVPTNDSSEPAIYEIIVFAFQQKNGNTGIDRVTVIIPVQAASNSKAE